MFFGGLFTFGSNAHAKVDNNFSKPYGLFVHNGNTDRGMPRIKALEVLLKYFPEVKTKTEEDVEISFEDIRHSSRAFTYIKRACAFDLFDCSAEYFYPYQEINQKDFLNWFFKLKYFDQPDFLKEKYPKIRNVYLRNWVEARRLNLFSDIKITYKTLRDFIYRNAVVGAHLGQPFEEILTLNIKEINEENYHNLKEIDYIRKKLSRNILSLDKKKTITKEEKKYLKTLGEYLLAFHKLEKSLKDKPYIVRQRKDLDTQVSKAIRKHGLQEVLYSHSYDYSKNLPYRKHNVLTGIKRIHGKVFNSGEKIDMWKIIMEKGLWDFKYGWVIAEGESQWKFGGGICGSSTMIFQPSWKAGLEILERRNHSQYYSDLYPIEEIGLDATLYRPSPNLKMRNNTGSPIVFNVSVDEKNEIVTVEVIGNKTYKDIRIEGPIYDKKKGHVKWIRHFEDFDGKVTSETLESRYGVVY